MSGHYFPGFNGPDWNEPDDDGHADIARRMDALDGAWRAEQRAAGARAALAEHPAWQHSGPCIYCVHGPSCVRCDAADSPHYGASGVYPGPVCRSCAEEIKRAEIAADPYYRGDYLEMFGDDA